MRQITIEVAISGFIRCLALFCTPFEPTLYWHRRAEDDEPETKTMAGAEKKRHYSHESKINLKRLKKKEYPAR
jgi:hypothetical protein